MHTTIFLALVLFLFTGYSASFTIQENTSVKIENFKLMEMGMKKSSLATFLSNNPGITTIYFHSVYKHKNLDKDEIILQGYGLDTSKGKLIPFSADILETSKDRHDRLPSNLPITSYEINKDSLLKLTDEVWYIFTPKISKNHPGYVGYQITGDVIFKKDRRLKNAKQLLRVLGELDPCPPARPDFQDEPE